MFRTLRPDERAAAAKVDLSEPARIRPIPGGPRRAESAGNVHTVMASGYGYRMFGSLMCARQTLQFVEMARAIRACHAELLDAGLSGDYARALASVAAAFLVRRLRYATRGCRIRPRGNGAGTVQSSPGRRPLLERASLCSSSTS